MSDNPTVLVIDDDFSLCRLIAHWLKREGYEVPSAQTAQDGLDALAKTLPDVILLDLNLPDSDGLTVLKHVKQKHPRVPVVMMTVDDEVDTVVKAMQGGAYDYMAKPLKPTKLLTTTRNAVEKSRADLRLVQLEREAEGGSYPGMVGSSPAMKELYRQMDRVAPSDITVLVHGESGTGKELVASALHEASGRKTKPFVALNCAAIPETLQESELFGHEKGSFTGAEDRRVGRFEQADGGTLFLDEVGELSLSLQAKLLRALQERSFYRVGGSSEVKVDVRIVAATHRDLRDMVAQREFREDLYYRLNVFELRVPPLRDRASDVLALAEQFLREFAGRTGHTVPTMDEPVRGAILRYIWPGNVRELRNAMERASVLARQGVVRLEDLPPSITSPTLAHQAPPQPPPGLPTIPPGFATIPPGIATMPPSPFGTVPPDAYAATETLTPYTASNPARLAELEKAAILDALERCGGNVSEVVRVLGIPRTTLYRRLKEYGLR